VALISKERALKTEHEKGELKLRTIFEKAETGIFQLNDAGEILASNPAFRRMLSLPEHLSHAPDALIRLLEGQELRLHLMIYQAIHQQQTMAEDFCIEPEHSSGQKKWIHLVVHSASEGVLQGLINDVTERKRQEEQAHRLAVTDHLTGLNNRLGFEREIQRLHKEHLAGNGQPFVLMMIDLDRFKQVNDTLGHHAGDQVLRHFATLLSAVLRRTDFTARLGGDEFIALLKDVHESATAQKVAEKS
jgi:PAS domain S-box-containing protein